MECAGSVRSPHLKNHTNLLGMFQQHAASYVLHDYSEGTSPTKVHVVMAYRIVHDLVKIPSNKFVPTTSSTEGMT